MNQHYNEQWNGNLTINGSNNLIASNCNNHAPLDPSHQKYLKRARENKVPKLEQDLHSPNKLKDTTMKESRMIVQRLHEKGYTSSDISRLIDISAEELESFLGADEGRAEEFSHITTAIKSVKKLVINEAPIIEGDHNVLGDNNCQNAAEVILNLLRLLEKKDEQCQVQLAAKDAVINKLLDKMK